MKYESMSATKSEEGMSTRETVDAHLSAESRKVPVKKTCLSTLNETGTILCDVEFVDSDG